jgi:hypothetical protein
MEDRESPPVYRVDSSDPARWQEDCFAPAAGILAAYLTGSLPASPAPLARFSVTDGQGEELRRTFHCDICQRDFLGSRQFKAHITGSRHRKVVKLQESAARPSPRLILQEVGAECCRQDVISLLKKALDLPLSEVLTAVERPPSDLGRVGPWAKAEGIVKSLAVRGIVVELRSDDKWEECPDPDPGPVDSQQLSASPC